MTRKSSKRHRTSNIPPESTLSTNRDELRQSSDHEIFVPSDTPDEFGEYDNDQLWPVKGIVSEEVNLFKTSIYQIEWEHWSRPDGTTTSWSSLLPGPNTILRSWKAIQTKKRRQEAVKNSDIDLAVIGSFKPHDIRTAENVCAYTEKLKLWPAHLDEWDIVKIPKRAKQAKRTVSPTPVAHSANYGNEPGSSSVGLISESSPRRRRNDCNMVPSGRFPSTHESIWDVEARWNAVAIDEGAANVRLINDIDSDVPVDSNFVYLEASRQYGERVHATDPEFLVGCDCKDGCNNPLLCPCLAESKCIDEDDQPSPAYDRKGRFLFNHRREVIECNINCTCRKCTNNVAQRARKIPIEVFKTRRNGWGVRPAVLVPKGTVLGLFTGTVMFRDSVSDLGAEERIYTFDMDTRDDDPEFDDAERYTISAYSTGNWTRFINHSCEPSAKVYSVVFDTTLPTNMPYLAFVACADIPARKDITIDYNPRALQTVTSRSRKGKGKSKSKLTPCICGSEKCRGFI